MILDNNIFYGEKELICSWDCGAEFRYGDFGPVYGWKNTIMTNNIFYFSGEKNYPIIAFPKYGCTADMYSAGNKIYAVNASASNQGFAKGGDTMNFSRFCKWFGDTTSKYLKEDPFADDGKATVSFRDMASRAHGFGVDNYIPVTLSHALQKETSVSYTVWDYETNEIIRTGVLHFAPYEIEKAIRLWEYDRSVLIELTSSEGVSLGSGSIHYQEKAASDD